MTAAQAIGIKILETFNAMLIGVMHGITAGIWYIEKLIAVIIDRVVSGALWANLTDTIILNLKTNAPTVLRDVLLGTGSGMGLLYLACFFVGVGLIVPVLSVQGQKIARFEHVVVYVVFIAALFLPANTSGYDLIGEVEKTRQSVSQSVAGGFSTGGLSALVADPLSATAAEMDLGVVALPAVFSARYYPGAISTTTYQVDAFETLAGCHICFELEVEDKPSRDTRREVAGQGLIVAVLNLLPAVFVMMLGAVSLMLTASAWVLILFFIFSIPIGLFEFGSVIQGRIATRYIFIWSLTILTSGLSGVVAGLARNQFTAPNPGDTFSVLMDGLAEYTVLMALAILLVWYVVQIAWKTMTSSFDTVQQSLRASLAPMASESGVAMPTTSSRPALAAPALTAAALAAPAIVTAGMHMATGAYAGANANVVAKDVSRAVSNRRRRRNHAFSGGASRATTTDNDTANLPALPLDEPERRPSITTSATPDMPEPPFRPLPLDEVDDSFAAAMTTPAAQRTERAKKRLSEPTATDAIQSSEQPVVQRTERIKKRLSEPAATDTSQPPALTPQNADRIKQRLATETPVATIGNATSMYGADPRNRYEARYKVVEMDDLIASNEQDGRINPNYPQELQPRERTRPESRLQVDRIAQSLEPDALLSEFQALDRGTPIVGDDNVVESGNGRTMALRQAREHHPERYDQYRNQLADRADQYGIEPDQIENMTAPVLVRERLTDVPREHFAQEANQAAVLQMSMAERAKTDAQRITPGAITGMNLGDHTSFSQEIRQTRNRPFVRSFMQHVPDNERAALVGSDGQLNQEGEGRIKAAMFTRVYDSPALTQRVFESGDNDIKRLTNAMTNSMGRMAKAENLVDTGQRSSDLSIRDDVVTAVQKFADLRESNMTVPHYLGQSQMFGRELNPTQERILRRLDELKRSQAKTQQLFDEWADRVENEPDPNQMTMFDVANTKEQLIDKWIPPVEDVKNE